MTVGLSYDATLSRVRVAVSAAPSNADQVLVERSTDQIRWTTVRGAAAAPLVAGAVTVDDYEFAADVQNYYRVSYVDVGASTDLGVGTAGIGNNASVVPGLPAAWQPGDLFILLASIRNSGAGTVNTPAGWTPVVSSGNVAMFARRAQAGDVAPTVTFAGGVLNADTMAQIYGRRNASEVPAVVNSQLNGSAQDIAYPSVLIPVANTLLIVAGWKQDDWTSVAPIASGTENAEVIATAGDDAAMAWDRVIGWTAGTTFNAGSFVVTGGLAAISRSLMAAFPLAPWYTRETASITPSLGGRVWIKSIARPFLNRPVTVVDFSDVTRDPRSGVFGVVGRSAPVAVNDVRGSQQFELTVLTETLADARDFDLALSSGDTLFVHVPAAEMVPGGYVTVGSTRAARTARRSVRRVFTLPCMVVAAPAPELVGVTYTWQGVTNDYATWADVVAANATWADLVEHVGGAEDVIVP